MDNGVLSSFFTRWCFLIQFYQYYNERSSIKFNKVIKMARVTTEDCLQYVDNQFDLVLKSAQRARDIAYGAQPLVDEDGDKPTVIALREISENLLNGSAPKQAIDDAMEMPATELE
jgi:DNA-directed RNA polymerase subunit omega